MSCEPAHHYPSLTAEETMAFDAMKRALRDVLESTDRPMDAWSAARATEALAFEVLGGAKRALGSPCEKCEAALVELGDRHFDRGNNPTRLYDEYERRRMN